MATVKHTTETKTKTITTEVPVTVLTLDEDEAQFLRDLMSTVGGDPKDSRRRHADAIGRAIGGRFMDPYSVDADYEGNIYFK